MTACNCGARTTGKWADVHSKWCAILRTAEHTAAAPGISDARRRRLLAAGFPVHRGSLRARQCAEEIEARLRLHYGFDEWPEEIIFDLAELIDKRMV
jgi:hypothetical protein